MTIFFRLHPRFLPKKHLPHPDFTLVLTLFAPYKTPKNTQIHIYRLITKHLNYNTTLPCPIPPHTPPKGYIIGVQFGRSYIVFILFTYCSYIVPILEI